MYLVTSSSSERSYVNQDQPTKNVSQQLEVCLGGFSGSNSNYSTYKSNCFSVMKERCSQEWDSSCSTYIQNSNYGEAQLFLQSVNHPHFSVFLFIT